MPVGLTKDAGWELGVRRTVPVERQAVWDFLLGPGLALWLGDGVLGEVGTRYETASASGEVRGRTEGTKIRLTHRAAGADHETTVQIALRDAASGTTIVFHQERMRDADEREQGLEHWNRVADRIAAALA
jgi:hypothetical protein